MLKNMLAKEKNQSKPALPTKPEKLEVPNKKPVDVKKPVTEKKAKVTVVEKTPRLPTKLRSIQRVPLRMHLRLRRKISRSLS